MNNKAQLIALLQNNAMSVDEISDNLNISKAHAWNLIHNTNKTIKYLRMNVKIIRGGTHGNSVYSLINNNTSPHLIYKNVNRHICSGVEHLKRMRETGLIGELTLSVQEDINELKASLLKANKELNDTMLEILYGTSMSALTDKKRKKISHVI